jgi:glyoxylase-like metal-dependent hydrolase (beta-lactamase superfamily II)
MTKKKSILLSVAAVVALLGGVAAVGCRPTTHPVTVASLGEPRSSSELEAILSEPGPVTVETVTSADWVVTRDGLINLDHPRAVAAGLTDSDEPIHIYFHALRHPTKGLFIIDTGVERALRDAPERAAIRGLVATAMKTELMTVHNDLAGWLGAQPEPLAGVFLTHLHLDHISGMPDVPKGTPIFAGPGETEERSFQNLVVQPVFDRAFEGQQPIAEWQFKSDPNGVFAGVLDIFNDRSVWALRVPGHTPGSTAYLARTPDGPVLLVGDACHTSWGWENGVEPGSFSHDKPASAKSLAMLKALVERHPEIDVRLGHQPLTKPAGRKAVVARARRPQ